MPELKLRFTILPYDCFDETKIEDNIGDVRKMTENIFRSLSLHYERYIFSHCFDEAQEMRGQKAFGYGFRIYREYKKIDSPFFVRMLLESLAGFLRQSNLEVDVDNLEKIQ